MPIPKPNAGESEKDFMGRCMGSDVMNREFPDGKQRAAVCHSQFRRKDEIEKQSPHSGQRAAHTRDVRPRGGESQNDFIGRCMSLLKEKFPDPSQRVAVCFSQFRRKSEEVAGVAIDDLFPPDDG